MSTDNAENIENGNAESDNESGTKVLNVRVSRVQAKELKRVLGDKPIPDFFRECIEREINGPPPERPTPLFPPEQTPEQTPEKTPPPAHPERVEAIVRREVKALAVLLLAADRGRSAADAAALVGAALSGRLQEEVGR